MTTSGGARPAILIQKVPGAKAVKNEVSPDRAVHDRPQQATEWPG